MRTLAASLVCALALVAGSDASAQGQAQSSAAVKQLGDYIRSADHLRVVGAAITAFEPSALQANCREVKPVKGRAWQPVEEPVFERNNKIPTSAAWQETWEVNVCGKSSLR